jgi:hypothetical protein
MGKRYRKMAKKANEWANHGICTIILILYSLHMARPLRIEYAGAVYHVSSGGNARKKIFAYNQDREIFIAALKLGREAL